MLGDSRRGVGRVVVGGVSDLVLQPAAIASAGLFLPELATNHNVRPAVHLRDFVKGNHQFLAAEVSEGIVELLAATASEKQCRKQDQ